VTTQPAEALAPSLRKDGRTPPFGRVLVANRGEVAVRIIRACHDAGVEAIAVYSDADASSRAVRLADHAVHIGPSPATESYLRGDRIIEAALATRAEAIHPGYGFLSERASFAEAVLVAGLTWIGPRPQTIAAVGDKLAARRLAAAAGVPVVPGSLEPALVRPGSVAALTSESERIGFPLFVKAAAGGGGRGMRRVTSAADLAESLTAASSEAAASFGDGAVYMEREIRLARHVEVQLLGDRSGRVVALGERDCSLQRRHQKLVEEAPAPNLTADQRRDLHAMAVKLGEVAGLENAATAEFLLAPDGAFWFLEVNTRLQVEHGVTELATGIDIVVEQLHLAAGRDLSQLVVAAAQRAARPVRHAIEVRLSAEDPARDFAPAPGLVGRWVMPSGPGVRVDTAVEPGERISPDYDPMIAKVLVVADDRGSAITRLARALDEVEVTGIQTTLPFLRFVAADPAFRSGAVSTDFVAERWNPAASRAAALQTAGELAARHVAGRTGGKGQVSLRKDTPPGGWAAAGRRLAVDRWPRR